MLFVQQLDQAVHSVSVISYILYLFFNHCQKMKLLLYPHGGSGNHGCEAIVRSTLKMIPTATLFSSNPDEDKRYGLDAICTLRQYKHQCLISVWRTGKPLYVIASETKKRSTVPVFALFFKKPTQIVMLCLSVGTIIATECLFSFIWSTNSFENQGIKTILWGCSVEPEVLKGDILNDLRSYTISLPVKASRMKP